jgi:hypothetical protein
MPPGQASGRVWPRKNQAAFWLGFRASELAGFTAPLNLSPASCALLTRCLAYMLGFVTLLFFLGAMHRREAAYHGLGGAATPRV